MPINAPLTINGTAFTGSDLHAIINGRELGTMQGLSVSIARETVAIYTMGSAEPRTFAKGKRAISGAFSFAQLDRDALLFEAFEGIYGDTFDGLFTDTNINQLGTRYDSITGTYTGIRQRTTGFGGTLSLPSNINTSSDITNFDEGLQDIFSKAGKRRLRYADELPPFDLTVMLVNSSEGKASFCTINGIVIMNNGYSMTVEDLTTEVAYTYAARSYTPLTPLTDKAFVSGGAASIPTGR